MISTRNIFDNKGIQMTELVTQNVYRKLSEARIRLQKTTMKKTGRNKFSEYNYFELGDFLPTVQQIFHDVGLCGVVSYTNEYARLEIFDTEDGSVIAITSPMSTASLKAAHPIQNLGAVETYQRRYLWMTAMEIVEHDPIDSSPAAETPKPEKPAEAKPPKQIAGKDAPWQIKVSVEDEDAQAWAAAVKGAAELLLGTSTSRADVMSIFKVNRNVFDRLKAVSGETYDSLMKAFKSTKEKFQEE